MLIGRIYKSVCKRMHGPIEISVSFAVLLALFAVCDIKFRYVRNFKHKQKDQRNAFFYHGNQETKNDKKSNFS